MTEGAAARPGLARVLVGLGVVLLMGVVGVYVVSERSLTRHYRVAAASESLDRDSNAAAAQLERGRHLVTVVAQCTHCHGPDLAGREMANDPWIGRLHASNLTSGEGGVGATLSDADWVAALRHGVNVEGRSLLLMPSAQLAWLSDRDLAAIVAYLRQVPPVDRVSPVRRAGWLTRVVVAAGFAPDLISAEQVVLHAPVASKVEPAATTEYGEYLVALGGCRVCHRADLRGGLHPLSLPGEPVPADLTAAGPIRDWSRSDFERAMRSGSTPDGRRLDREFMPWPAFAGLADVELDAIWRYLGTLDEEGAGRPRDRSELASRELDRAAF